MTTAYTMEWVGRRLSGYRTSRWRFCLEVEMDTWVWIVLGVVVVAVVAGAVAVAMTRRARGGLRDRFGPEYERTVETSSSRRDAERDLRERASRREEIELRALEPAARDRYRGEWQALQTRFVDRPQVAVADADELVKDVMRDLGYPIRDFESNQDLISVDHPVVVENYRTAHGIYVRTVEGNATTEDLRQAVVSYRALFNELMKESAETRR
jgi:hypothetical protein